MIIRWKCTKARSPSNTNRFPAALDLSKYHTPHRHRMTYDAEQKPSRKRSLNSPRQRTYLCTFMLSKQFLVGWNRENNRTNTFCHLRGTSMALLNKSPTLYKLAINDTRSEIITTFTNSGSVSILIGILFPPKTNKELQLPRETHLTFFIIFVGINTNNACTKQHSDYMVSIVLPLKNLDTVED